MAGTSISQLKRPVLAELGFDENFNRSSDSESIENLILSNNDTNTDNINNSTISSLKSALNPDYKFVASNVINKGELFNIYNNGGVATARTCRNYLDQEYVNSTTSYASSILVDNLNNRLFLMCGYPNYKLFYVSYSGDYCNVSSSFDLPTYTGTVVQVRMDSVTGRIFILSLSGSTYYLTSFTISTSDNQTATSIMSSTAITFGSTPAVTPYMNLGVYNGAVCFCYRKLGEELKLYADGGYYSGTTYTHGNSVNIFTTGGAPDVINAVTHIFTVEKNISGSTTSNFVVVYSYSSANVLACTLFKVGYTNGTVTDQGDIGFGIVGGGACVTVEKTRNRICIFAGGQAGAALTYYVRDKDGAAVTNGNLISATGGVAKIPLSTYHDDTKNKIILTAHLGSDNYVTSRQITLNSSDVPVIDATVYDLEYYTSNGYSGTVEAYPSVIYSALLGKTVYVARITYSSVPKLVVNQSISSANWDSRALISTASIKPMFIAQNNASVAGDFIYGIPILIEKVDNSIDRVPASAHYFDKFTGEFTDSVVDAGQATLLGYTFNRDYLLLTVNYYDL